MAVSRLFSAQNSRKDGSLIKSPFQAPYFCLVYQEHHKIKCAESERAPKGPCEETNQVSFLGWVHFFQGHLFLCRAIHSFLGPSIFFGIIYVVLAPLILFGRFISFQVHSFCSGAIHVVSGHLFCSRAINLFLRPFIPFQGHSFRVRATRSA